MWLILSLLAAVSFGLRGILYHAASRRGLNRSLMLCGVFTTGAVLSLGGALAFAQQWSVAALCGMMMGVFSYAANASMFKGFAVGKPSLIAILTALPPVVVVIFAYLLWGETLNLGQLASFVIILGGILLVRYSNDLSLSNLQGAGWGLLATLFFGMNDVTGKLSTVLGADMFPTLFWMFVTGTACFGLSWLYEQRRRPLDAAAGRREGATVRAHATQHAPAVQPQAAASSAMATASADSLAARPAHAQGIDSPLASAAAAASDDAAPGKAHWTPRRTFLAGLVVGLTNISGMVFILSAFETGITSLVSAVIALNVLIILLYTRLYLRERFTPLELTGMATAFVGIVLLRVF